MKINEIIKTKIDTTQISEMFGGILDSDGRANRITEQRFLKFALENNIDPMIYYSILNQRINEVYYNQLSENINPVIEDSLKFIFDRFDNFATNNSTFGIGDKVSLIELLAEDYGPRSRTVTVRGFSNPKEIVGRNQNFVVFEDGSAYPSIQVFQTRTWKQIALFDDHDDFEKCEMVMTLLTGKVDSQDGDWEFEPFQIEN
jgi:hypothetical protein